MKAIIVDDEPKAIDLLKTYLEYFNNIDLIATFRNGLKAFEYISREPVDLIFLDINMPHISGITLSKMLPENVKIIFTTAYSEYAVESYEIQAFDYLVKPISLERFTKSISRIIVTSEQSPIVQKNLILVKSGYDTYRLKFEQIIYLEKDRNYMIYHCTTQKIIARESIQESLEKLPDTFIQTHKSYIVNKKHIVSYDKKTVNIGKRKIQIGDAHKENLFAALKI